MDNNDVPGAGAFDRWAERYGDFYPEGSRSDLEFRLTRKLILVSRWWTNLIEEAIRRETDLSRAKWQTLFAIAFSNNRATILELSERMGIQWPSLVRTLNALEADGWVERLENPADGRSRLVVITPAGRAVLTRVQPVLDRTRAEVLRGMTNDELRDASTLLTAMMAEPADQR